MSRIYGNAVAIDGAEVGLDVRVDSAEINMSANADGEIGVAYRVGNGTMYHDRLRNRELPDQHPIEAVTALEGELALRPSEVLTNMDIYNILNS